MKPFSLTAETLADAPVLAQSDPWLRSQAWTLAYWGNVRLDDLQRREARLTVAESRTKTFEVHVTMRDGSVLLECPCTVGARGDDTLCLHKQAAALALGEHLRKHPVAAWDTVLAHLLKTKPRPPRTAAPRGILVISLQLTDTGWYPMPHTLSGAVPEEGWHDAKALAKILRASKGAPTVRAVRTVNPGRAFLNADPDAARAAALLAGMAAMYQYGEADEGAIFGQLLPQLLDCPVFLGKYGSPLHRPLTVLREPVVPSVRLDRAEDGLHIQANAQDGDRPLAVSGKGVEVICNDPLWVVAGDTLFSVENGGAAVLPLLETPELTIPPDEEDVFLEEFLEPLAERVPLEGNAITWDDVVAAPEKRLYLSDAGRGALRVALRFGYADREVSYAKDLPEVSTQRAPGTASLARIHRDPQAEQAAYEALTGYGLKRGDTPGQFVLRAKVDPIDFLLHHVPRLAEAGYTVFGEESLTAARVNRNRPKLSFNVSTGIDWFDVGAIVTFGDLQVSLKDIRRAIRKRNKYVKLADGSIGVLPDEWLEKYQRLFGVAEETESGLRFSKYHALLLEQMVEDADGSATDEEFRKRRDRLKDFSAIAPHEPPEGFRGELRHYQKTGYDWLHFLHEYGFGGCLADDMGLGKTAEALAFLLSLRESGHADAPDLIVLPRSLLFNWQREAARFTPSLKVFIHADKDRPQDFETFDQYDLILTTYGIMLREIETLRKKRFHYAVLDESQAIKNPLSQTARAARLLNADHRLVLTGTPVENNTTELWSQFAFLNPGLLGGLDYFNIEYAAPIERRQNTEVADLLRKMVFPFILRRTKAQVAPELPPRTERILYTDMEPGQRKMYDRVRDLYRAQILGLIDDSGMNNARMKVLEGLLRLRQICNDPRTVDKRYKGGSGKFEALLETLETLREEDHKALVFSQFVQMLDLVRAELDAREVPYMYLDGSTRDRQTPVDTFQNDPSVPFFLVSLKAGGLGLNLTAADYVIHIDPWWNPAVEMQASDRTHRIGQDKPVFIYKLIMRDSVEEKIVDLQRRKRGLVDQLISADSGFLKALTRDDVEALFA